MCGADFSHRLSRRQDRRKLLVLHLDHERGAARGPLVFSSDDTDGFADIPDLPDRQNGFVLDEGTKFASLQISTRQDTDHAWKLFRSARVVGLDACMSMRATQNSSMKHSWPVQIRNILRPARHFLARVQPWDAFSNHAHGKPPSFARQTASTILT